MAIKLTEKAAGEVKRVREQQSYGDEMFLRIGVADSLAKEPFFDIDERCDMLEKALADNERIQIKRFSGLLIDFARECGAEVIIRGLRAISDFEYEVQLAGMNRSLAPEIETVFLTAAQSYAFVSSSLVREIARLDGDVSEFLHPHTMQRLTAKLQNSK